MTEALCPFCAEPVGGDDEKCRSCGERLDGEPEVQARGGSRTTLAIALVGLFLLLGGLTCFGSLLVVRVPAAPMPAPVPVAPLPPPPPLPPDPGQATDAQIQALELGTVGPRTTGGITKVSVDVYSWGGYALIDVGAVRIAVRGVAFPGARMRSDLEIRVTGSTNVNTSSSATSGGHTFRSRHAYGVTTCQFDGLHFEVEDGKLTLFDSETVLDVEGAPQVVVVDADGANPVVLPYTGP